VVEVEAAQEHLVGFAGSAVLGDDKPGNGFQHIAGAQQGAYGEIRLSHHPLGGGARFPRQHLPTTGNHDLFKRYRLLVCLGSERQWQYQPKPEKSKPGKQQLKRQPVLKGRDFIASHMIGQVKAIRLPQIGIAAALFSGHAGGEVMPVKADVGFSINS
jgi:hypothetical protein